MKIVHINLFDYHGGAATIANALIKFSRKQGHTVHQFVFHHTKKDDPFTIGISSLPKSWQSLYRSCEQKVPMTDFFMPYLMSVISHPVYRAADLVHLHCINGNYFSILLLPFLGKKKLIWTFHDTIAFTAHCLYPHLCDSWKNSYCSACPLDQKNGVKSNRELFQKTKEAVIDLTPMTVVAPSRWIMDMTKQSIFSGKDIRFIYNGVDTDVFYPRDKDKVRSKYEIPENAFVLMFAAHGGVESEMKGGKHMLAVLRILQEKYPDLVFLHVGSPEMKVPEGISLRTFTFPYIEDQEKMAELYSAADVFISASLTESFGLTVCEAMACGVPVAAFAAGGIQEIVEDRQSGWLVPLRDEKALINAVCEARRKKELLDLMRVCARLRITKEFSLSACCESYEALYQEKKSK